MSKTTIRKGKQDDKFSLAMREIQGSIVENKKCFDCEQRGPTYVNITVGSFVCTKCSGMLRGMNPPHRIKSISMSTFTPEEVELMRGKGNLWCARVWLANYDRASNPVDYKDDEKIKDFMIAKYERKRYYCEPTERTMLPRSSPSASSISSTSSQEKPLSSLIGTTLKAHIAQSQQSNPASTAAVSRPSHQALPRPQDPARISSGVAAQPVAAATVVQQLPKSQPSEFANFADFDSVAFDSLPADPLSSAATTSFPTNTLPPMKAVNQVMNNNTLTPMNSSAAAASSSGSSKPAASGSAAADRYSALKELDDLFKTSTIQNSPGLDATAPETSVFGSAPAPKLNGGSVFPDTNGSVFPEVNGRNSPAGWAAGNSGTTTAAAPAWTPAAWSSSGGPGSSAANWLSTGDAGWGGAATAGASAAAAGVSTNPFGSSPSATGPLGNSSAIPENNNDLFAAAPKPFISQKQGLDVGAGNPWSSVPAFTSNMTPAHNPHNPFL